MEAEKKLNDHITFHLKLINNLPVEVKVVSTKGLTKHFINGYIVVNGVKDFVQDGS